MCFNKRLEQNRKNFPAKINFTDGKTSNLDYYLEKNWIRQILFNLMKKKNGR
jgi:hypothetical protein